MGRERHHVALVAAVLAAPVHARMTGKPGKTSAEIADAAHWDAVEEVVELLHEERFRDAIVELRDVLRADAANAYAYYFLGIAFFEIGELEPARDAYAACLKLAPGHIGARVALSHVLRATGNVKGAIREGVDALARSPGHVDALHAVGLAYHAYGDEVAARRYFEAFLASHPEYEAAEEVKEILATLPGGREPEEID
ncbi:MAG: tetratricopeptide repeat protein [Polyangiaceae bacterium]